MARGGTTSYTLRRMRASRKADGEHWHERRRASAHALLNRHWITKDEDPELFYAIRDQYQELRDWFAEYAGFSLILTRTMAKLDKSPVAAAPWMGIAEFREPRDYALFTYALWYLENKTELDQFVLTDIIEQVSEQLVAVGLTMDWENYGHRMSMVRALKKLRQLGVLRHIDGDEGEWARDDSRTKNVLYECAPTARYVLRHFPRELEAYETIEAHQEQTVYSETTDGELRRRRHRVYRRLLLEPAVADREWAQDELFYVQTQRRSIMDQLQFMLGLEGSRYREGLYFYHPEPSGECTLFPTAAAVSDLALLLAGELRRRLGERDWHVTEQGTVELSATDLEGLLYQMKERYGDYWSKEHRSMGLGELAAALTGHMAEWGLGAWRSGEGGEQFVVSAALSRWNADYAWDDGEVGAR
ncbi:TIGR02678 family protein [Paenibacillus sp. IB182496]|uniref:TIGR02678 family protein n=1 Tax=Paenibacillus sabuli TaxID=2772509 RepID=A0A927BTU1_9BACL|nr:TIGR02678 family protein [Paenibacillus sabuli]MBD2846688.1 TIGR02678 family protein [Paenibacillus sabuli]